MSRFLLDTNICVHLLKNEYDVKEKISDVGVESCYLSEITLAELLYGIENSAPQQRQKNLERFVWLETLFRERTISISAALHEFGKQKAHLRRIGRPVGDFDILIGATAVINDFTLITHNTRDFRNLHQIRMFDWIS
ncbi:PIN domain-containing protein [Dyadobacter aurulentus]|uniref:PIN domain-containing protein n=1 Tax=Dyadobacter sp. UC 10 TaxID=2605428 RepID=UPI0011F1C61B|nr:PIN domain-containing protein [Dyadobacter sp. UC 10]KAA0989986.1 type II toxin-antitoxin system VapC family toxin [Dyadobacter sp. UC 10]